MKTQMPHLGWSSAVYPLEAGDLAALPEADGAAFSALPADEILLLIRPGAPDALLRGRALVAAAAARDPRAVVPVRIVFVPTIARWNVLATCVRVLRNRYRYKSSGTYHIAPAALRTLGVERALRTPENPQPRGKVDRKAKMAALLASLRATGFDDARPICVHVCRVAGRRDSLRQGHHRISACLECGVTRMALQFCAAGALARRVDPGPLGWTAVSAAAPFAPGVPQPAVTPPAVENRAVFLENKYINDVFETGVFAGAPCIVKHSRTAVWSIGNEYRLNARLYAAAPAVVPRPLAWHQEPHGKGACVITERIAGPSLTQLLAQGLAAAQADAFARDIRALAAALRATGVVHRDLFADNLLLGADGHLKAIDWQLAIDRAAYREDPWVARHWKFRYVVFGVNRELGLGRWDDAHALGKILARFPQTATVKAVRDELAAASSEMSYAAPPRGLDRARLWLYGCSLRVQMLLRGRRHRKYAQLERRWKTVRGRF